MEYYPLVLRDFLNDPGREIGSRSGSDMEDQDQDEDDEPFLFTDEYIVDFFWELFYCIYYARVLLGYFQHLDIAVRNVLVSQDDTTRVYGIRGRTIQISSPYRPVLIDFGISQGPWSTNKLNLEWSKANTKKGIDIDCYSILHLLSHIVYKYQQFFQLPLAKRMRRSLVEFVKANERVCEGNEIKLMEELLLLPNTFTHSLQAVTPPTPPPPPRPLAVVPISSSPNPLLPPSPTPPPLSPRPVVASAAVATVIRQNEIEKEKKEDVQKPAKLPTRASIIPFHFTDTRNQSYF